MIKPLIALTMGDPAGIGPEILLKALSRPDVRSRCCPVVFGDAAWLANTNPRAVIVSVPDVASAARAPRSAIPVIDLENIPPRTPLAVPSRAAGRASGEYIAAAVLAVRQGAAAALVTAPINKQSFALGGWGQRYVGHTEMLAALTRAKEARLMLVHGKLRAAHVTSHISLAEVPSALTTSRIVETIRLTAAALRGIGIKSPRIAVCALNPHAGDDGLMGSEERRLILPAVRLAAKSGIKVHGPIAADVVWPQVLGGRYDAGVAMYHDQGQIAIKLAAFQLTAKGARSGGVNVTLGLPIIRTSPAHGTAYDIAGRGKASEESLVEAILMAAAMAGRR